MNETFLRGLIHGGFFLLLLVPLLVMNSMFFPYITGKTFFFRSIVEIMFVAWVCLAYINPIYRPRWSPITIALTAFLVIIGVANMLGENPARSFWSNFERMEGYSTLLHIGALMLVVGSMNISQTVWNWFLNASIVVSSLLAVRGLYDVVVSSGNVTRIDGTLGNSTYFAVYLLFNIFIALIALYTRRTHEKLRLFYGAIVILQILALYYTGTRGAILGIIGGLACAALVVCITGRSHPRIRMVALWGVAVLVACVGLFVLMRDSQFVQGQPTLARIANISLEDDTTQSRLTLWSSIGWEGFKERPLLGWGQDNFIVVFGKYYDPIMYKQEPWFDRAHNVFVDWAIAGGLLGLLAYVGLFVAALWMIAKSSMVVPEKALLIGLLVAYGIHNLFVFDHLVSYIYFALMLAFVHGYRREVTVPAPAKISTPVVIGAGVLAIALIVIVNGQSFARAQTLLQAIRTVHAGNDYQQSLNLFERALEGGGTGIQEAQEQLVQATVRVRTSQDVPQETTQAFVALAESALVDAVADEPQNTRRGYFLGVLLRGVGDYERAAAVYEQLLAINPYRQNFLYDYADILFAQEEIAEAVETLNRAYTIEPENDVAFVRYATAIMAHRSLQEGEALLLDRFGTTTIDDKIIIDTYLTLGRKDRVVEILKSRLTNETLDLKQIASAHISIGAFYMDMGRRDEALEHITRAIDLYPEFAPQGQQLIDAIKAGKRINIQ